ncbi:MAG: recombinase family protein [Planctomycetota bacterium]|jgi:hypothetical protein|nr:recombinase family protein [Planctomycetota bacterium]MDP6988243.1 recombinase family protein [Planctomycetota bacterium]
MPKRRPQALNDRSGPQVAVGYLRRSTDRQEQSIPDQRKAIERYAAEHDLELARFFVDDAISGTSAVRRPAFQEMVGLAQQERRPFSYVIVDDVKRFGRLDNDEATTTWPASRPRRGSACRRRSRRTTTTATGGASTRAPGPTASR